MQTCSFLLYFILQFLVTNIFPQNFATARQVQSVLASFIFRNEIYVQIKRSFFSNIFEQLFLENPMEDKNLVQSLKCLQSQKILLDKHNPWKTFLSFTFMKAKKVLQKKCKRRRKKIIKMVKRLQSLMKIIKAEMIKKNRIIKNIFFNIRDTLVDNLSHNSESFFLLHQAERAYVQESRRLVEKTSGLIP